MKFYHGARKQQQLGLGKWTKAKSAALEECISVICRKNIFGKKAKNVVCMEELSVAASAYN